MNGRLDGAAEAPMMSANAKRPHLLVFEPEHRGHPLEWLQHLVRYAAEAQRPIRLSLAAAPNLVPELHKGKPDDSSSEIRIIPISGRELDLCNHASLSIAAFARWRGMRRMLRLTQADHGYFISMDFQSLPLALGLRFGRPVSGALFRPSIHYGEMGGYVPSGREQLRDLRKRILYRRMLRHPELMTVFSLDPYFAEYAAEHYADGTKVQWLPDPVPPTMPVAPHEAELAAQYPEGRCAFLLFGVLTERKGILVLLEALSRMSPEVAARTAVLAAGRVDPPIAEEVGRSIDLLAQNRPELWFRLEDRHLAGGEIEALVARAEVVLAPYQRFVGSSGVLVWAAARGTPVLVQDYGLLGRFTRDHGLGLAVDTRNPGALAAGIEAMVQHGPFSHADRAGMASFAAARTASRVAAEIMTRTLHAPVAGPRRKVDAVESQKA